MGLSPWSDSGGSLIDIQGVSMSVSKVLLISMPFGALERQALGISLLKAILKEEGVACDIRYLSFTFAELIGADEYYWLSNDLPHTAFAGEWLFTSELYGDDLIADNNYIREILKEEWKIDNSSVSRVLYVRNMVQHFLDYCMETIAWQRYALVGFTSTFEQNISSLALAKRIKEKYPRTSIVFGGGNWEGEMGEELHRCFPFVDYACMGEADQSFPVLAGKVLSGDMSKHEISKIKGVVYRSNGQSFSTGPPDIFQNMDRLPIPDYSDYFMELEETPAAEAVLPNLLIETSRGCWWGQRNHCTFCGLNGRTLGFRSKSPKRAVQEVAYFIQRWKFDMLQAVDNVIDMEYFRTFLPAIAEWGLTFFYEVRSNLSREQVKILKEAGVIQVQPGIESLNDHVLKLMRKGTTALRNIQLLKWFKENGISAGWNLLYGFPGEKREDYIDMFNILPTIRFLQPPNSCGPVRLDRFSPYFNHPEAHGITNVKPISAYRYLYPFPETSLKKIAYYFDYSYKEGLNPEGYADDIIKFVDDWKRNPETGTLKSIAGKNGRLFLVDTRACALRRHFALSGMDREVYEFCDSVRSSGAIVKHLGETFQRTATEDRVKSFLNALVANRLMVTDGNRFLSLALRSSTYLD